MNSAHLLPRVILLSALAASWGAAVGQSPGEPVTTVTLVRWPYT